MGFYIIGIKGKWQPPRGWQSSSEDEAPIRQPLGYNIYMIKYFMTFIKIKFNIILFLILKSYYKIVI